MIVIILVYCIVWPWKTIIPIRDMAVFEIPIRDIGDFEIPIRDIGNCEISIRYARAQNFDTQPAEIPIRDMTNFENSIRDTDPPLPGP